MPVSIPPPLVSVTEGERKCSYLPEERAALHYRFYESLTPAELEELISRGWRRFGVHIFRPDCRQCQQCVPIRIDVENFKPSKSQRKIWKKNQHIRWEVRPATITPAHIELFNEWHRDMAERSHWRLETTNFKDYTQGFLSGQFPSQREIDYFDGDRLIGVGLIDVMPHSLSSAYFYHAPDWRAAGPGTFSLLCEIEFARQQGLSHVYLGFWIERCPSMSYKNRFHPHEVLTTRPADDASAVWQETTSN